MAIALSQPIGGGPMGPGYYVIAFGFTGPTALDDLLSVWVTDTGGQILAYGDTLFAGHTSAAVIIGLYAAGPGNVAGITLAAPPGAACNVVVSRYTHAGAFVEGATFTGFTWDPTGGLWALMVNVLLRVADSDSAAVLAAVRKVFP